MCVSSCGELVDIGVTVFLKFQPFYDYINKQKYDPRGENVLYNIGVMRKVLQIGKNVSDCLGHNLKCDLPRFLVFSLDTSIYAAEKIYSDVFHCFLNVSSIVNGRSDTNTSKNKISDIRSRNR